MRSSEKPVVTTAGEIKRHVNRAILVGAAAGFILGLLTCGALERLEPLVAEVQAHPDHSRLAAGLCKQKGGWRSFSWAIGQKPTVTFSCKDGWQLTTTVELVNGPHIH